MDIYSCSEQKKLDTLIAFVYNVPCLKASNIIQFGRLAQLVEHLLDVQVVSGSIPLTSTT